MWAVKRTQGCQGALRWPQATCETANLIVGTLFCNRGFIHKSLHLLNLFLSHNYKKKQINQ